MTQRYCEVQMAKLHELLNGVDKAMGPRIHQYNEIQSTVNDLKKVSHNEVRWTAERLTNCLDGTRNFTEGIATEALRSMLREAIACLNLRLIPGGTTATGPASKSEADKP